MFLIIFYHLYYMNLHLSLFKHNFRAYVQLGESVLPMVAGNWLIILIKTQFFIGPLFVLILPKPILYSEDP